MLQVSELTFDVNDDVIVQSRFSLRVCLLFTFKSDVRQAPKKLNINLRKHTKVMYEIVSNVNGGFKFEWNAGMRMSRWANA